MKKDHYDRKDENKTSKVRQKALVTLNSENLEFYIPFVIVYSLYDSTTVSCVARKAKYDPMDILEAYIAARYDRWAKIKSESKKLH